MDRVYDFSGEQNKHGSLTCFEVISKFLSVHTNCKVLVIDSFRAFMSGDENSSAVCDQLFTELQKLCTKHGLTIFVIHHMGKSMHSTEQQPRLHNIRGSSAIYSAPRLVMVLDLPPTYPSSDSNSDLGPVRRASLLKCTVLRESLESLTSYFHLSEDGVHFVDKPTNLSQRQGKRKFRCYSHIAAKHV